MVVVPEPSTEMPQLCPSRPGSSSPAPYRLLSLSSTATFQCWEKNVSSLQGWPRDMWRHPESRGEADREGARTPAGGDRNRSTGPRARTYADRRQVPGSWYPSPCTQHLPTLGAWKGSWGEDGSPGEPSDHPGQHPPSPYRAIPECPIPSPAGGGQWTRPLPLPSGQPLARQHQPPTPPGEPMSSAVAREQESA